MSSTTQAPTQTRNQFLNSLSTLKELPDGIANECSVCLEELEEPIQLPCKKHIFCKGCITEWLSFKNRSTCPQCRLALFDPNGDVDRSPSGADRLQIVARALEHSRLTTEDRYDVYSDEYFSTTANIQRAAAHASRHLVEENHSPMTGSVVIDIHILAPHIIAMANLLRGYARATGRPYSGYQRRDWKLIVGHLYRHLDLAHRKYREGNAVDRMAREYGARIRESLSKDGIDLGSGRFFESGARLQSPSGDLDVLLNYVVSLCAKTYQIEEEREAVLRRAQQEALANESTKVGWAVRKAAQKVFGIV